MTGYRRFFFVLFFCSFVYLLFFHFYKDQTEAEITRLDLQKKDSLYGRK